MNFLKFLGSTAVLASLAACGSTGLRSTPVPLIGPGATLGEAETVLGELETRVLDVEAADGETPYDDLPINDATYTGVISGGTAAGGSGSVAHYADLSLSTDFDTDDVTGSITNVVTDVADFENPTGTINVTGTISNVGGIAELDFSGSGPLVGDGVEADYILLGATGTFVGTDGAAIMGDQETDIEWTAGPDSGDSDISDGLWYAERD